MKTLSVLFAIAFTVLTACEAAAQIVINELSINPSDADQPYEYIEIKGTPTAPLTNIYLVVIDGDLADAGKADYVFNLGGANGTNTLGTNGLMVIKAASGGHTPATGTIVFGVTSLNTGQTGLENGSSSYVLIESLTAPVSGTDYDPDNMGWFTVAPMTSCRILDAVGWKDEDGEDKVYGATRLRYGADAAVEGATRFSTDNTPFSTNAWYFGKLAGTTNSTTYSSNTNNRSANFPTFPAVGALTPGALNGPTPGIAFIPDQSGVVSDTTTPAIPITLSSSVTVTATSGNQSVVPNANLVFGGSGVNRTLTITPIAVGYDVPITVVATGIGTNVFRYSASSGFVSTARFHTASSDASAAITLDSSYMLVGDDETHSLRLYSRTSSGLALKEFNFKAFLNTTNLDQDGFPKEPDIEAATKVPNRIYWITSHGNSGDGSIVPNRNRLFATALSGSGASSSLAFTGYYEKLRDDLINWDKTGGHKKGENYFGFTGATADLHLAKSIDGFNIEGMTMLNGSTNIAYLAFRAPLTPKMTRRNALLVPILNLPNLVTGNPSSGPAVFGDPIELDLGGRGIRSIEGNGTSYVIIAGSPLEATGDPYEFRIFTWSGNPLEAPQERSVNLSGLNPEAIVEIPAGTLTSSSQIQILSDNGNAKWYSPADNTSSKDLLVPNWKKFRSDWITIGTVVPPRPYLAKNPQARAGRFTRGSGTDTQYHSYVTAVDQLDGVPFDATSGNADQFYPSHDWTPTLAHYNATSPGSPITFKNPLASFGSQSGATPLYLDRSYTFKVGFGDRPKVAAETGVSTITISVYDRNTMAKSGDIQIPLALNPWSINPTVISDGIEVDNDKYGLKTTLRLASVQDGNPPAFYLTHEARKTDYIFLVKGFGYLGPSTNASARPTMVKTNAGSATWSPLYVMNFDSLPPWRSAFIDQPHFDRIPMPSELAGKSVEELMSYSARFTNQPSISVPTNYLALDASAELRRHPALDQLVSDLAHDPIALANYVQNEIQLTDALSYNDQNAISDQSVNLAGVNRGALATYLEGQGSPQEQCALLMYLLRRAQIPAAYLYPQTNSLKILDSRLSKLLRMQIRGAVTDTGISSVPHLVPVNYPWITAYVGGQWVHLFPWLKDTEITEGFNLYDFMPEQYNSATKWTRGYLQMHNAIMLLASQTDTITDIFPRYLQGQLRTNYPGISIDDLGVQINDRRHYYARWSDFPQPTVVGSNFTVVESLASITNSFPAMTNLFDLINIEVTSSTTPANKISTGDMLVTDLHNRQFTLWYQTNAGGHAMTLSLASFRPDTTASVAFSAFNPADPRGTNIMNKVASSVTLASNEDEIKIKLTHKRHRALADSYTTNGPSRYSAFLGFDMAQIRSQVEVVSQERTVRKGDLISICVNPGRVTGKMMELQNQNYFAMQEIVRTNSAATNSFTLETYQGKLASLLGSTYFQKVDRFRDYAQKLHKAQTISWYSVALSQLGAERNSNGTLVSGAVKVNKPRFDLVHQQLAIAGNGTIHADVEQDPVYGSMDFYELLMVEASALEHAAINDFYDQSKAVSSVNILQRAQLSGWAREPGILELNATNYLTLGETLYPSGGVTKLKAYDPGMWQTITNAFTTGSLSNNVRAWITPGPITNEIGKHMGALVFGGRYFAALLSTNLNGAEGMIYTGQVVGLVGGASTTTLYFGNDGQWHDRSWFGDLLDGGDKVVVDGPRGEQQLNVNLTHADRIALSLLGPNVTEAQIVEFLIDRGYLHAVVFISYYSLPSNSDSTVISGTSESSGFTGTQIYINESNLVLDPVDAISGSFYNDEEDLALTGPFPLAVRRNYSSHNQAHNEFGHGWKISYFPYLVKTVDEQTIYAATPDGSVVAYSFETNNTWRPTVAKNPQASNSSNPGSQSSDNIFLSRIEKVVGSDTRFIVYDANGTVRTYIQKAFPTADSTRERPYLDSWRDHRGNTFYFSFGTNSAATDYGQVRRIRSSSGSYVNFSYDTRGHIVEAFASDGRKVQYEYDYSDDLVAVTRPDGSRIEYEYSYVPLPGSTITNNIYGWINSTNNGVPDLYRGVVGTAIITNKVSSHLISRIIKPDGRILENDYDNERRVTAQRASAGLDLNPIQNATFSYTNNFVFTNQPSGGITGTTGVKDFFGNTTVYSYNAGLMTQVRDPLGQISSSLWYGADTNGGYRRSLAQTIDKRGLSTAFKYDSRGNVTNVTTVGNLTGIGNTNEQRVTTFVYDTNSVLQTAITPSAITNRFFYAASNVWLLTRTEIWPAGATSANAITNSINYTNVSLVFTNGGVVYTNFVNALPQQFLRAAGSSEQASKELVYNSRGYTVRVVQRTGTSDPDVVMDFVTDDRGNVVEKVDGAGRKTRFGYDAMGRVQSTEWYEASAVSPLAWNFTHYNPNGEVVWQDGPAFDPEDYVWMDYDGAGRMTTQIRWRARAKTDGSGIEAENGDNLYATTFNEYDPFGNLLKVRESLGHFATFNYDALGRKIQQTFYASNGVFLKSEKVAYEPGDQITLATNGLGGVTETLYTSTGQPRFQRQPTGATNAWTYYLDGRPKKQILNNGSYWEATYDDVNRRVTNTFKNSSNTTLATKVVTKDRRGNEILAVDLGGNVFTNYFDGLDRLKGMAGPVFQTIDPTNAPPNPGGSAPAPLQQALTNYFDAAGVVATSINGVGDKTLVQVDALGRPLIRDIRNSSNQTVRLTTTTYFTNHHGMIVTEGNGSSAITRFAFTDNDGQVVLSSGWSLTNRYEFTLRTFDVGGKLLSEVPASHQSGVTTYWPGSYFGYDGLGRVTSQTNRDNAVTTFTYDAMGNVLFRMNPGNLGWAATYNSAGQMLTSYDYSGVNQTRNHSHTYYSAGHAFAGLQQTFTDARNVVCTHVYDEWLRPLTNSYTGTLPEHYMREVFSYEERGMLASLTEQFATNSTGAATTIERTYDPYGQLATESILINTNVHSTVSLGRDSAGRRTGLGFSRGIPFGFNYGWRADGALSSVEGNFINGSYGYDTAGILTNRKVGSVTMNVTSRDGFGRPLARATTRNGGVEGLMSETLTWTGDGLLNTHTTIREFTDERVYGYSSTSRRLAEERLRLSTTTGWTNVFGFDEGSTAGIGALTRMAQPQTGGASWTASLDAFQRIDYETNNVIRRLAYGNVNSQDMFENLTVRLDGKPLPLTILQTSVTNVPLQWSSMMELAPGNHTLEATVLHRSGLFTNTTSHVFTNTALDITTLSDFNEGMLSQRQVRNVSNVVARTQNFSWDAKGRLWKIKDRDANTNGFDWVAIYDALGRRLENTSIIVTNNTVLTSQPKTIQSYYDPSVEFLELGVRVAGIPMAKFYGPDLDGNYGSMNGTGGFDGVTVLGPNFTDITVSDARGNLNGFYDDTHGGLYWTAARHTGYGAVPQYRPVPLGDEPELISASLWRGRWSDRSGFYYLGARYYDPVSGSFISPDPLGYSGGSWLYGFAEGDPINAFDPDGRLGRGNFVSMGPNGIHSYTSYDQFYLGTDAVQSGAQVDLWTSRYGESMVDRSIESLNGQSFRMIFGDGASIVAETTMNLVPGLVFGGPASVAESSQYGGRMSVEGSTSQQAGAYALMAGAGLFAYFDLAAPLGAIRGTMSSGQRALRLPDTDGSLLGTGKLGYTTPQGDVFLNPGLTRAQQAYVLRHEATHVFFTPRGTSPIQTFRQNLGQFGYDNSQVLRFVEEAIAEGRATGSLRQGLRHPLVNPYGITRTGLAVEGTMIGGGIVGAGYLGYQIGGGR